MRCLRRPLLPACPGLLYGLLTWALPLVLCHTDCGVDMYLFSLGSESPKGAIGHIVPTEKNILAVEKNKVLLPPLWSRTLSWGFDDFSCCLGNYGSEKVRRWAARCGGFASFLSG